MDSTAYADLVRANIALLEHERKLEAEIEQLREVKAIRDGITDALEAAGYFHMSNADGITAILRELEQLRVSS